MKVKGFPWDKKVDKVIKRLPRTIQLIILLAGIGLFMLIIYLLESSQQWYKYPLIIIAGIIAWFSYYYTNVNKTI
jgi:uncharacterized membrane protein SirB2